MASRTTARRLPTSRARAAAVVSARTASARMVCGTPRIHPSSCSISAAVARWWAISSIAAVLLTVNVFSAIAFATPAWRAAREALVSVWYAASRTESLRNSQRAGLHLEQADVVELADRGPVERLAHRRGELLERGDRAGVAEGRRVVERPGAAAP